MRAILGFFALIPVAIVTVSAVREAAAPAATGADQRVVVVELFTSQGCSSCPAADRVLAELSDSERERVVPLAFHVDYWNYIGWQDPFSSAQWTQRQHAYAGAFRSGRIYTPQAIVDGRTDVVGSDGSKLQKAIAAEAVRPGGRITITAEAGTAAAIAVRCHVLRPESLRDRQLDLMVALYEDGLVTAVKSGENSRRTLRNERVVRQLLTAATLPAGGASESESRVELILDPAWNRARLGVAAFLQDPATRAIEGASDRPLIR